MWFEMLDLNIITRTNFLSISLNILILYISWCLWSGFASLLGGRLFLDLYYSLLGKRLFIRESRYSLILPTDVLCIILYVSFISLRCFTQLYLFSRMSADFLILLRYHNIGSIARNMTYFRFFTLLRYFIILMYCFRI